MANLELSANVGGDETTISRPFGNGRKPDATATAPWLPQAATLQNVTLVELIVDKSRFSEKPKWMKDDIGTPRARFCGKVVLVLKVGTAVSIVMEFVVDKSDAPEAAAVTKWALTFAAIVLPFVAPTVVVITAK